MAAAETAERLAAALARLGEGDTRTRPVSVSLPGVLVEAIGQLTDAGEVASTSAAVTEALTAWAHNRLLRLALDELYGEHPDLRPAPERIRAMADELGVVLPPADGR